MNEAIDLARKLHRTVQEAGATMTIETRNQKADRLTQEIESAVEEGKQQRIAAQEQVGQTVIPDGVSGHVSQDPLKKVFPPTEDSFEEQDSEFIRDDRLLDTLKNGLIAQWPEFGPLKRCHIDILWKAKGGASGGKLVFGKCSKMSGLALFYSGETFVIWIAADHVRDHAFNQAQLEALIYHELSHCGWELDEKTGETKWSVVAHDVTTFLNEVNRYGAWTPELQQLRNGYEQLALTEGNS